MIFGVPQLTLWSIPALKLNITYIGTTSEHDNLYNIKRNFNTLLERANTDVDSIENIIRFFNDLPGDEITWREALDASFG